MYKDDVSTPPAEWCNMRPKIRILATILSDTVNNGRSAGEVKRLHHLQKAEDTCEFHRPKTNSYKFNVKKCDLGQPSCERCSHSGRICEGYARYPVFLNRNAEGLEKRYRLAEAKSLPLSKHERSRNHSATLELSSRRAVQDIRKANDDRMLAQPNNSATYDQQIISSFWEKYIPSTTNAQGGSPCVWLQRVIDITKPGEATYYSLKALAMTRLGWIHGNHSLALQGNMLYSRGLQALQRSLWNDTSRYEDSVLAAGYVLSVYELFESTVPSIFGWNSHISGLGNLVLQRGPTRHRTLLAQAVFEEFRTSSMIQCIQFRKSSFLGNSDWLTIPWGTSGKDVYQRLYDKGFALAALLEDIDNAGLTNVEACMPKYAKYLHRCSELDAELEEWYQEILQESPSPLYWTTDSERFSANTSDTHSNEALETHTLPNFSFHTLRLASITVTFWALKLILGNTIALLCDAILSISKETHIDPPYSGSVSGFRNMAQRLLGQHASCHRLRLASNIMRSMSYCLNDSMGLLGAAKSLFGLRVALYALRRYPGEELRWCQAVYQELVTKKGLRYAREIAKLDGKYSAAGRDTLATGFPAQHTSGTRGEVR